MESWAITIGHACYPITRLSSYAIYTVSQKNDIDAAQYNFNTHQPILIIFGRDVAPAPPPPLDNVRVMVIVWRLRGKIIRTALCWIV